MELQLEQIRDQQKATWNKFSPGWRKWDDFTMNFMQPMGDTIINSLQLKATDSVLDVAAGTGEPGLTIAGLVPQGRVVITDLAEGMLEVARDKAANRGITNIETVVCDISELPFNNESFDAVSCRFGFMFFPDMLMAAKEMARVLKKGGRIATVVWTRPTENQWITATMSIINKHMQLTPPPPGAPGMFRCGAPHFMKSLFEQAGLKNIWEQPLTGQIHFESGEHYWTFMNEVAAPVVAAMSQADEDTRQRMKEEVMAGIDPDKTNGKVSLNYETLAVSGEK